MDADADAGADADADEPPGASPAAGRAASEDASSGDRVTACRASEALVGAVKGVLVKGELESAVLGCTASA